MNRRYPGQHLWEKALKQGLARWSRSRQPQLDGCVYLPALCGEVVIQRDSWGIPHVTAANRHDLFLAQGFVHAQDRLWQMELNRRAANGELSAVFGPATLATDRLARTLGFARLALSTWQQFDDQTRADVEAYTAGVNAYLQSNAPLPVEFSLLRHRPQAWRPLDSVAYGRLQMWALTEGAMGELVQAQLIEKVGAERAAEVAPHYPAGNPVTLPEGIELNGQQLSNLLTMAGAQTMPFLGKGSASGAGRGSNAWVIAAGRSATGHAILCNDMHLPVGTPSVWYYVHLQSNDGLHVAGFSQPGLPYVLVGHNAHVAWGATLAYTDCEDLFVEQLHPGDETRYSFRGRWRQAEVFEERIAVRGRSDHVERVVITHHGPIVSNVLPANGQVLALSSTALRPRLCISGFRRLNEARHWDDFVAAVEQIHAPALNLLYADTQDNIGYWVSGCVPVRAKGEGLVPAPGWSGEYEWIDDVPFNEMPHALNPRQGYLISANHRIVDDSYPHFLGRTWRSGYRARRLEELITGQDKVSLADCQRFQLDFHSIPGRQLAARLASLETTDADAAVSLRLLQQWDGRLGPESVGGAVYQVLLVRLAWAILEPALGSKCLYDVLGLGPHPYLIPLNEFQGYWTTTLLRLLANSESSWLPPDGARRRQLVERCLAETTAELRRRLGDDPEQWQWGCLHRVCFEHALGVQTPLDLVFNQGPFPIGGDGDTVAQTSIRPDRPYHNNAVTISSRHIIDLGDLSRSQAMLAPGQSGQLGSPYYGNLIRPWLEGTYFPMTQDREKGRAARRHQLSLRPPM